MCTRRTPRSVRGTSPLRNQFTHPVSLEPSTWTCCKCNSVNHFTVHSGQHPRGALSCECPHKPCESCTFKGVTHFLPIIEPGVVPVPSLITSSATTEPEVPFGVICSTCGLSWRVEEKDLRKRSGMGILKKMPSVRDTLHTLQKHRLAPSAARLRKTKSLMALRFGPGSVSSPNLHAGNEEMVKKEENPASFSTVMFSGLTCSCGRVSNLDSFCFRVVQPKRVSSAPDPERTISKSLEKTALGLGEKRKEKKIGVRRHTDEELTKKGHDDKVIRLFEKEHPNPLRSAPVGVCDLLQRNYYDKFLEKNRTNPARCMTFAENWSIMHEKCCS